MPAPARFQNHEVIELKSELSCVRIAPQFGARLLDWRCGGSEIIHWPADADWTHINKVRGGNPVLFPFIARHMVKGELARWTHPDGRILDLPMHGFARDIPFAVVESGEENTLCMRLEDTPETRSSYPYAFRFDVWYQLHGKELLCGFEVTNRSSEPMPWHAGHHFYFSVPAVERADWTVTIPSTRYGRQNPDGSISYGASGPSAFLLSDETAVDRFQLLEPGANAELTGPEWGVHFDLNVPESLPWHTVTTWTLTPESNFYCVEPWLGLPNAIHHGEGIRWLAPGTTERAVCRLRLTGLSLGKKG